MTGPRQLCGPAAPFAGGGLVAPWVERSCPHKPRTSGPATSSVHPRPPVQNQHSLEWAPPCLASFSDCPHNAGDSGHVPEAGCGGEETAGQGRGWASRGARDLGAPYTSNASRRGLGVGMGRPRRDESWVPLVVPPMLTGPCSPRGRPGFMRKGGGMACQPGCSSCLTPTGPALSVSLLFTHHFLSLGLFVTPSVSVFCEAIFPTRSSKKGKGSPGH